MRTGTIAARHLIPPPVLAEAAAALRTAIPGIGIAVEYPDGHAADPLYQSVNWDLNCPLPRRRRRRAVRPAGLQAARQALRLQLRRPARAGAARARRPGQRHPLQRQGARRGGRARRLQGHCGRRDRGRARHRAAVGHRVRRHAQRPAAAHLGGTSCAVANAHPEVLAAATHVIGSNDEDGVAALPGNALSRRCPVALPKRSVLMVPGGWPAVTSRSERRSPRSRRGRRRRSPGCLRGEGGGGEDLGRSGGRVAAGCRRELRVGRAGEMPGTAPGGVEVGDGGGETRARSASSSRR